MRSKASYHVTVRREQSQPLIAELEIWMRQQRALLSTKNDTPRRSTTFPTAGQPSPVSSTTAASVLGTTPPNGTALADPVTTARPAPETGSRSAPVKREPRTETHANKLARDNRKKTWDVAEVVSRYWHARIVMNDAAACAQRDGLPEGQNHPLLDFDGRMALVDGWREAKAAQL
jgi:hypothetical protein